MSAQLASPRAMSRDVDAIRQFVARVCENGDIATAAVVNREITRMATPHGRIANRHTIDFGETLKLRCMNS